MLWLVLACSLMPFDPDEQVSNPVTCSANGRFCVVLRRHEGVADFQSERAGALARNEPWNRVTVAWYEASTRWRMAEFAVDAERVQEVMPADSGRYLAGWFGERVCGYGRTSGDPLVTIYRADGSLVGKLDVRDVFSAYDSWNLPPLAFSTREEDDGREVLVIGLELKGRTLERRIDLASATLLDEKHELLPGPSVWVTPVGDAPWRPYEPVECALAFKDAKLVSLDSEALLARATHAPLPEFPLVAVKARIRGTVRAEVVVAEDGSVACARHTSLPFGIAPAAGAAVRQWRFEPLLVDGRAVRYTGEVVFHFEDREPVAITSSGYAGPEIAGNRPH